MSSELGEPSWEEIRSWFPTVSKRRYLNAAGMTPLSKMAHSAGQQVLDMMRDDVRTFATSYLNHLTAARARVAAFYKTEPSNIAFTQTSSMGMGLLAISRARVEGRRNTVVTLEDEFPSSTLPWVQQGFELKIVSGRSDGTYDIEEIVEAATSTTAIVVASYVQFNTGARLDAHALAEALAARGVPLVLNATQAAGVIPIDLSQLRVDAMVVSGNKWLMAGPGNATLYVSPKWREGGFPPVAGWLSGKEVTFDRAKFEPTLEARGVEVGLGSLIPTMALAAAIEAVETIGVERISKRVHALTTRLLGALADRGARIITPGRSEDRAGIVSVHRPDAASWVQTCEAAGVIAVQRGPQTVRISPHVYNNLDDIEALLSLW